MSNTAEFLKTGKYISVKPTGSDYNLEAGKIYDLAYDPYEPNPFIFTINGELNMPKRLYELEKTKNLQKRILTHFEKGKGTTTTTLLTGVKGTGKSIDAKIIAKNSGLPIIIISPSYPASKLTDFFKRFTQPVCIIFDEIEKHWDTKDMLEFLDGMHKTCKKLVLMTSNDTDDISEYMFDRCSRIRYIREYESNENLAFIPNLLKDFEIEESKHASITDFITNRFEVQSMDNMCSFLEEVKLLGDVLSIDEIAEYMNITLLEEKEESDE